MHSQNPIDVIHIFFCDNIYGFTLIFNMVLHNLLQYLSTFLHIQIQLIPISLQKPFFFNSTIRHILRENMNDEDFLYERMRYMCMDDGVRKWNYLMNYLEWDVLSFWDEILCCNHKNWISNFNNNLNAVCMLKFLYEQTSFWIFELNMHIL